MASETSRQYPVHLDAQAAAIEAVQAIDSVLIGKVDRAIMRDLNGDVTIITEQNALETLEARFNADALDQLFIRGEAL